MDATETAEHRRGLAFDGFHFLAEMLNDELGDEAVAAGLLGVGMMWAQACVRRGEIAPAVLERLVLRWLALALDRDPP